MEEGGWQVQGHIERPYIKKNLSFHYKCYGCQEKCHSQRKLTRKVSRPRARFNGRLKLLGWLGKDGTALTRGWVWLL
jgi:hypothetical protein